MSVEITPSSDPTPDTAPIAENEGLPSVNRRRGSNQLVTVFGFVFILGCAVVLFISLNSSRAQAVSAREPAEPLKVASTLPPLVMPNTAPPPPPPIYPGAARPGLPGDAQGYAATPGAAVVNPNPTIGADGRPIVDWTDRKLSGGLLVNTSSSAATVSTAAPASTQEIVPAILPDGASEPPRTRVANNDLASHLDTGVAKAVLATRLPNRNFLITKGTTLDCALETALDSSLPGLTTCRLTRDVYSDDGQVLLLDRGAQLTGEYQGGLAQGQVRLFVVWTRAKTPSGVVVALNSPGTDALGRSGLDGFVDEHFMKRFGAAILMSYIQGTAQAVANSNSSGTTNVYGGTYAGGEKVIEKILDSSVNIPPTLVKNQGEHIQVMVARDLDFSGVYALKVRP